MCGIVAAVSRRNIVPVLLEGLRRLEYRGYDSCGVAVATEGGLRRARSVARVAELKAQVEAQKLEASTGISHTRWATHGAPEVANAHPHFSHGTIGVVHNGIIENYEELRAQLASKGYEFTSQTDTEVIAHLVHFHYSGSLLEAVERTVSELRGSYGIAVIAAGEPDTVVAARQGSPLVVGLGENENFAASDAMAIAGETERFVYLAEGDVAEITPQTCRIFTREEGVWTPVEREVKVVHAYSGAVDLGPYRHYMQKEIFEQPRAIADTLEGVNAVTPELFGADAETVLRDTKRILFLACGTSYYAALTAKYWIEAMAGLPVDVEIASEYRYRASVPDPDTLVVTVSQSGETADTLSALRHARDDLGMTKTLTICNVATSAMVNESRLAYITRAGVEIGVASTKAFTTQLVALYLLALTFAKLRGRLSPAEEEAELKSLRHVPTALGAVLALEPQVIDWAERFATKQHALFLGRGLHYPIALEGALKLKEISYIHAEAYPAGELKHGPLALVDKEMPVVTVAPNDRLLEKLKSNMQEVRARGGELYVFADGDSRIENAEGMHVIRLPENYGKLSPVLHVVPLQLLAYHTALTRGTDVDKPRNLAKSVTVE
ncbi:glutamine--fructose-6-phosphate transaminase (isomerizing) [Sutterella megalosphaeroides]|uniref:Glutamine--fructose-6-phosphate aminotransferase [isomerizing] n=1 Tax=Sutterella megalosphaeroides TaxID=2494234 RepID=A0A2Z6I796_9BURK|nr:glutamine--fructose-6-phosphate transaminase (isomerizing) [Sutterella megalosphaeroides]BBF22341.1 glutamine--fructose-6-phosphate aminotransferase [isomerizing] [Sutterella megalosphaeroides]